MAHPNSLANLRPWKPGEKPPPPGPKKVEQALKIAQQSCPKAARLIARCIGDPELPISTRLRCAEFMLDKALPSAKSATEVHIGSAGVEWLELRFTAPGGSTTETHRISLAEEGTSLPSQAISTTYEDHTDISPECSTIDAEPGEEG